jgi:transcription initiation factor TFIIE subunit alpha
MTKSIYIVGGLKEADVLRMMDMGPKKIKKKSKKKRKKMIGKVTAELLANAHLRQLLINIAGENALSVIREFTEEMSDDELARKCKVKLSEVRMVLNKLHSFGLVRYTRLRDKDSWWYIWDVNEEREQQLILFEKRLEKNGEKTKEFEGRELYCCGSCKEEKVFPFEVAFEYGFKCPSCGKNLEYLEKGKK